MIKDITEGAEKCLFLHQKIKEAINIANKKMFYPILDFWSNKTSNTFSHFIDKMIKCKKKNWEIISFSNTFETDDLLDVLD